MDALLIDTNVLVYAYDPRDQAKQRQALAVLAKLVQTERAALSAQCLSEFYQVATNRLPEPLTAEQATEQVERWTHACMTLNITAQVVVEACRGCTRHSISIWDALIWSVAKLNQVPYILTEDAEHNRYLEGVRFLNPFTSAFDMSLLDQIG